MAAAAELSLLLLFAFISGIHDEGLTTILEVKGSYTFKLPDEANICVVSRFVGEQKLVLWNTSELWSENTKVPEDLKKGGSFFTRVNTSSNTIHNLTHSDSGLYQVECWIKETATEENVSVTVCSVKHEMRVFQGNFGATVDLLCKGAADKQTVQWLKHKHEDEQGGKWTSVSSDGKKSQMDNEEDRLQVLKNSSTLRVSNYNLDVFGPYNCLIMDKQRCISSQPAAIIIQKKVIYRSVGGSAVLNCSDSNSADDQPQYWFDPNMKVIPAQFPQNFSDTFGNSTEQQQNFSSLNPEIHRNNLLVLSSLSLNNTGLYICMRSSSWANYFLLVCPEFGPAEIQYFSEGDVVTLRCNHSLSQDARPVWIMKTDRGEDTIVTVSQFYEQESSINRNVKNKINMSASFDKVVLSKVSVEDRGEYWCAIVDQQNQCILTAKTILIYRGPLWIYLTSYALRSLLLIIPCTVMLTVTHRTRRREQLSDI